jgi:putative ABC transport system substrate-binding protein
MAARGPELAAPVKRFIVIERGNGYTGGTMRRTRSRFARRVFLRGGLALAGLGMLAGCGVLPPGAQQPPAVRRIGFLDSVGRGDHHEAFRAGLRDLGWAEGQNLTIEWRFAETSAERLLALAAELVGLDVALVVANNTRAAQAVRQASGTVPVVLAGGDVLGTGLVANMARPDGNVTGVTNATAELCGKRLELLKEAVPALSRIAVLSDPAVLVTPACLRETETAAPRLGARLQLLSVGDPSQLDEAFAAMGAEGAEGLVVFPSPLLHRAGPTRERIIELATRQKLAQIWEPDDAAAAGGLISYGPAAAEMYRQSARYVDKLLRGARPAELPLERPTRFYLKLNLGAAQALGLTIAPAFLLQATEIIQ